MVAAIRSSFAHAFTASEISFPIIAALRDVTRANQLAGHLRQAGKPPLHEPQRQLI
jgi:hypothetical protein